MFLLRVTNSKKSAYLAVTSLSELLAKKSSNDDGDFYCLNCENTLYRKNTILEKNH